MSRWETVRVEKDGTVTYNVDVPHRAANIRDGGRIVAAPPHRARASMYRGDAGIPRGVNLNITVPHTDCSKHIPGF